MTDTRTKLIILAGIPGSGKTTYARTLLWPKYRHIETDGIRVALFGSLQAAHETPGGNQRVFERFHQDIDDALKHSVDTVADATFLTQSSRQDASFLGGLHDASVHLMIFANPVEAIHRNDARPPETCVPGPVMLKMRSDYYTTLEQLNRKQEHYDTVTLIRSFDT